VWKANNPCHFRFSRQAPNKLRQAFGIEARSGAILTAQGARAVYGLPNMSDSGPAQAVERNYLHMAALLAVYGDAVAGAGGGTLQPGTVMGQVVALATLSAALSGPSPPSCWRLISEPSRPE
jgi:hypothetical protein